MQNAAVTRQMTSCSIYCICRAIVCFVLAALQQRLTSQNMPMCVFESCAHQYSHFAYCQYSTQVLGCHAGATASMVAALRDKGQSPL